ncbi:hypothetical protein G6F56_009442 [Rhizopus delemar]|nr:hypothetical protein G6F56_009442 [Rhizopus delemar]
MSGSAKAVSRSGTKFIKGVDAFLNDAEKPMMPEENQPTSPQGNLFSSFSSFWSRTAKEFSQTMEEAVASNNRTTSKQASRIASPKAGSSDDDSGSAYVNVDYPKENNDKEKVLDI